MKGTPKSMRKTIRTEIGQTMITNIMPGHKAPPIGEPWRAFLFVQQVYETKDGGEKRGQVHVEVLEADTSDGLDQELLAYAEKPGRLVLEAGFELRHFREPDRRSVAVASPLSTGTVSK